MTPAVPAAFLPVARSGAATAVLAAAVLAAAGAAAARGAYAALRRCPPAGEKTWMRTNHRGELVTLLEGPAVTVGAVTAQVAAAAVAARLSARGPQLSPRQQRLLPSAQSRTPWPRPAGPAIRPAAPPLPVVRSRPLVASGPTVISGLGALAFGLLDDLAGSAKRKGFRGHLGALAQGEVTTGSVKLAGLAATGLVAAAAVDTRGIANITGIDDIASTQGMTGTDNLAGRGVDVAINAALVAGGANLLNLFDLRPGRAVKVATLAAALIVAGERRRGAAGRGLLVAAPAGAALALLPEDLGERAMLGDAGANAIGAMLGAAAAQTLPRPARIGLLAGIVALTAASEKVSFTRVIERTPPLRWLDMLGRRPSSLPAPGRHRRPAARVRHIRSGSWTVEILRRPARPAPAAAPERTVPSGAWPGV